MNRFISMLKRRWQVARFCRDSLPQASGAKSRPISERMQAAETRIPAGSDKHSFKRFALICVPFFWGQNANRNLD
jgi:hypothetical protein